MPPYVAPTDKRVCQRLGMRCRANSVYQGANPSGPAGSALMTIFCVFTPQRVPTSVAQQYLWNRSAGATAGWYLQFSNTGMRAVVVNGTPAFVVGANIPFTTAMIGQPQILFVTYNAGTLSQWCNGVASAPTVLGAGFTAAATRLAIGCPGNSVVTDAMQDAIIHECGLLDAIDLSATAVTVQQQIMEDLQQGRYLDANWPRVMTVNDTYYSARDAQQGLYGSVTWVGRDPNAVSLARTGSPQLASYPMRFA